MTTLIKYAESELDRVGMTADNEDEMNLAMRDHILRMVRIFSLPKTTTDSHGARRCFATPAGLAFWPTC